MVLIEDIDLLVVITIKCKPSLNKVWLIDWLTDWLILNWLRSSSFLESSPVSKRLIWYTIAFGITLILSLYTERPLLKFRGCVHRDVVFPGVQSSHTNTQKSSGVLIVSFLSIGCIELMALSMIRVGNGATINKTILFLIIDNRSILRRCLHTTTLSLGRVKRVNHGIKRGAKPSVSQRGFVSLCAVTK